MDPAAQTTTLGTASGPKTHTHQLKSKMSVDTIEPVSRTTVTTTTTTTDKKHATHHPAANNPTPKPGTTVTPIEPILLNGVSKLYLTTDDLNMISQKNVRVNQLMEILNKELQRTLPLTDELAAASWNDWDARRSAHAAQRRNGIAYRVDHSNSCKPLRRAWEELTTAKWPEDISTRTFMAHDEQIRRWVKVEKKLIIKVYMTRRKEIETGDPRITEEVVRQWRLWGWPAAAPAEERKGKKTDGEVDMNEVVWILPSPPRLEDAVENQRAIRAHAHRHGTMSK